MTCTFHFADEPQFQTKESRQWAAHYLKACRTSRGNFNCRRYTVIRIDPHVYSVQLAYIGSPVAIVTTRAKDQS